MRHYGSPHRGKSPILLHFGRKVLFTIFQTLRRAVVWPILGNLNCLRRLRPVRVNSSNFSTPTTSLNWSSTVHHFPFVPHSKQCTVLSLNPLQFSPDRPAFRLTPCAHTSTPLASLNARRGYKMLAYGSGVSTKTLFGKVLFRVYLSLNFVTL